MTNQVAVFPHSISSLGHFSSSFSVLPCYIIDQILFQIHWGEAPIPAPKSILRVAHICQLPVLGAQLDSSSNISVGSNKTCHEHGSHKVIIARVCIPVH